MRPIDADLLKEKLNLMGWWCSLDGDYAKMVVDTMSTLDVETVKHGRFVQIEGFMACSERGASPADWEAKPNNPFGVPPFCHSCGAKMDAKEEWTW